MDLTVDADTFAKYQALGGAQWLMSAIAKGDVECVTTALRFGLERSISYARG